MPYRSRRSRPRRVARLVTAAVVGAVVLGAAPTAIAFALDGEPATAAATRTAAPTAAQRSTTSAATATPLAAARRTTTVSGWASTPKAVRAGKTLRALVRVTGGQRTVRLERLVSGSWKVVGSDRSSRNGAATVSWKAPAAATRAVLRLHVLRSGDLRSAVTPRLAVTVRPAAAPAATATAKPSSAPTKAAPASPAPAVSGAESLRAELLVLVNRARATARTCGGTAYPAAAPLARSGALDRAAGDYALKMGTERFFAHESPDGSTMVSRLKAVGVSNTTERENIAAGQTSASSVMAGWLASPGHCANIMAKDVTRVGLGHATVAGSPYGQYWVQDFAG